MLPTARTSRTYPLLLFITLGLGLAWLHWLRLEGFWGDHARWMFEVFRFYKGEWPYRDYSFTYPPLTPFLFRFAMNLLGPSFQTIQIVLDLLSLVVVLLFYSVARRLFPHLLSLVVTLAFLCGCAALGSTFALFSMTIYIPAMLLGTIGLLLLFAAYLDRLSGAAGAAQYCGLIALGGFLCWLSKPEYVLAFAATWLTVFLIEVLSRKPWIAIATHIAAGLLGTVPALLVYAWVVRITTQPLFAQAMTSYGVTAMMCPLWPTGLSLLGVSVAIAQGWTLFFFAHLIGAWRSGKVSRALFLRFVLTAVISVALYLPYIPYLKMPRPFVGELPSPKIRGDYLFFH